MAKLNFSSVLSKVVKAFKESFLISDSFVESEFENIDNRRTRYALLWAFYENTAYREIHKWAQKFKSDMGLYKYVRNIYNPANRLGIFWQTHLYGGSLDLEVGGNLDSALPVDEIGDGDLKKIKSGLAQVWKWSNWAAKKDLYTLYGTVLGDVGIKIVDDTEKKRVYFEVVHPGAIKEIDRDRYGFIKAYHLEEPRIDEVGTVVVYEEIVTKEGDNINVKTLKNSKPFVWNGVDSI